MEAREIERVDFAGFVTALENDAALCRQWQRAEALWKLIKEVRARSSR